MRTLVAHEDIVAGRIRVADKELLTVVDETNLGECTNAGIRNRRSVLCCVLNADELVYRELLEEGCHTR